MSRYARNTDPDTSHAAVPHDTTAQARQVLRAYANGDLLLDEVAYERVGLTGHQRCTDLRRDGLIQRIDRATTKLGKRGYRCRITFAGRLFLKAAGENCRSCKGSGWLDGDEDAGPCFCKAGKARDIASLI